MQLTHVSFFLATGQSYFAYYTSQINLKANKLLHQHESRTFDINIWYTKKYCIIHCMFIELIIVLYY